VTPGAPSELASAVEYTVTRARRASSSIVATTAPRDLGSLRQADGKEG
jgi:hypothetical protein